MKAGSVILVKFPFTNLETTKKRPALILNTIAYSKNFSLITIAMITSRIEDPSIDGDYLLSKWKEAGLLHPSLVRMGKLATIENELIDKQLGELVKEDLVQLKKNFKKIFFYWIK